MKAQTLLQENLRLLLQELSLTQSFLSESYEACSKIGLKKTYQRHELVEYEALSSRYARASDLLLQRVFRSIDSVELVGGGTLIDALHRAEKRVLIDSLEQMYSIRELRNLIVHEYLPKGIEEFFSDLLQKTPVLIDLIQRTLNYSSKLV